MVLHLNAQYLSDFLGGFSPLLEGDGLASADHLMGREDGRSFQSPSRRGWSCIGERHRHLGVGSPRFSPLLEGDGLASPAGAQGPSTRTPCFSPLLEGDGLASRMP